MCDGFDAGTLHWLIRDDGVLGLTVIGPGPGNYQIVASPPVLALDQFGMWLHLAVVLDGNAKRVSHYVNGQHGERKGAQDPPAFSHRHSRTGELECARIPGKRSFDDPELQRRDGRILPVQPGAARCRNPRALFERQHGPARACCGTFTDDRFTPPPNTR